MGRTDVRIPVPTVERRFFLTFFQETRDASVRIDQRASSAAGGGAAGGGERGARRWSGVERDVPREKKRRAERRERREELEGRYPPIAKLGREELLIGATSSSLDVLLPLMGIFSSNMSGVNNTTSCIYVCQSGTCRSKGSDGKLQGLLLSGCDHLSR